MSNLKEELAIAIDDLNYTEYLIATTEDREILVELDKNRKDILKKIDKLNYFLEKTDVMKSEFLGDVI